jgi:hypothetical protein
MDRALGWSFVAAGGLAVVVGWVGVSGAPTTAGRVSYLVSGGVAGLLLLCAGVFMLLTADVADYERRLGAASSRIAPGRRNMRVVLAAGVAGAALIGLGWNEASIASDGASAIPGVLLAAAGVGLAAAAVTAHVARWRRQLHHQQQVTVADVDLRTPARNEGSAVVAPGLTRFHRPGCLAVAGVDAQVVPLESVRSGLRPCGVCHPLLSASEENRA